MRVGQHDAMPRALSTESLAGYPAGAWPDAAREAPECSFRHEALFYSDGDHGFLRGTLHLVLAAVQDDAAVLVAVGPDRADALKDALGEDSGRVAFADMHTLGRNPARIIPVWHEFMRERGGGHPLGIGEPVWPGRNANELGECQRHEALLNLAFDGGLGWHLLCPYDLDGLEDAVIEAAHDSHPVLVRDGASYGSESYLRTHEAPSPFAGSLTVPAGPVRQVEFTREDLGALRLLIADWAEGQSLGIESTEELVLAVNELTTNSIRYGGGQGTLRWWREDETLLCEVQDDGLIEAPLVGRTRPTADAHSGRGVWIANQLCDLVQIRSAAGGSLVRVHKSLL
jgi:anti-sigma regulatory factor (Ser/Thr protein kinase)